MSNSSPIQAIVFDWAGTIVDFGSFAPTTIFVEAFKQGFNFDITLAEAREPMGIGKWDHIKAVGQLPGVKTRWIAQFGKEMSESDVDTIYAALCLCKKPKSRIMLSRFLMPLRW